MGTGSGTNYSTTPNMGLPEPTPGVCGALGVEPAGKSWLELLNAALTTLDSHTHAGSSGVPVPSAGIGINADLTFAGYNVTNLRAAKFGIQGSTIADTCALYFSGVDLWANDASGNKVQITSGGGVAGSPGSIGGLVSPAAATYTPASKLFSLTSDATHAAYLKCGPLQVTDASVSSGNNVQMQAPASLANSYNLTLPAALPAGTNPLFLDSSGNVTAPTNVALRGTLTVPGATTLQSTLGVTGAATLSSDITAGGNFALSHAGGTTFNQSAGGTIWLNVGGVNVFAVESTKQADFWGNISLNGSAGTIFNQALAQSINFQVNGANQWSMDGTALYAYSRQIKNLATPTDPADASTKGYVDGFFPVTNAHQNFGTPSASTDVAIKSYVDGKVFLQQSLTISGTSTSGSFGILQADTNYRVLITPTSYSGTIPTNALVAVAFKSNTLVTVTVQAAPGSGNSVTFDVVAMRF